MSPPIDTDAGMNMPDLGLAALAEHKDYFLSAVALNLAPLNARLPRRRLPSPPAPSA